jgi:hypothetical protein
MFSNTPARGRERFSSLLHPRSSTSSSHHDNYNRPQSAIVASSTHFDLLSSGGVILEHEWAEQGGLPYSKVPDKKKTHYYYSPAPPIELEVRDEVSIAMGGGGMVDLWDGVEFGYRSPSWDIAPGLLRLKSPPSEFPGYGVPLTLYPNPSTPFFIRAPSWRALLRLLASLNETSVEPTPEAVADTKRGAVDLRLVVQFVKTPFSQPLGSGKEKNENREVALYLCLHQEVPSTRSRIGKALPPDDRTKWRSWDTSILPYGFRAATGSRLTNDKKPGAGVWMSSGPTMVADAGTPIREQEPDGDSSMFVALPPPFVELPVTLSNLALYLQDNLVLSRRGGKHRATTDPKGQAEDPGKTRNVLEKANKSTTNLTVPAPTRPLSIYSAGSISRPSTSHSYTDSSSGTQHTPTFEADVERGRGFPMPEQQDPPFSALPPPPPPTPTPESSPPSPVISNRSSSPLLPINPAQIPGIKRLSSAIKAFYPDEYAHGSSHPATEVGGGGNSSSKPQSKGFFGMMKNKTSYASGALKSSIGRGRERDSNMERFELVSPYREPGL